MFKCAKLGRHGSLRINGDMAPTNACWAVSTSYFAIVAPGTPLVPTQDGPEEDEAGEGVGRSRVWWIWVGACGVVVAALALSAGFIIVFIIKKKNKYKKMEERSTADDEVALGSVSVNGVMERATCLLLP